MYANNERKFVAVLNTRHPLPLLMNALGHLTAGLAAPLPDNEANFLHYDCPGAGFSSNISEYPFIVTTAKNSSQLRRLVEAMVDGVAFNVFTTTMLAASADEQREATRGADADTLDYVAVVLFGAAEAVDPLTRRFSLFKG